MAEPAWDNLNEALATLRTAQHPHWKKYLGFYSSWLGGYFREPWAMLMPIDDHGFHRGDAVFEAARLHEGAYFDLSAHLVRLQNSARAIGMELPQSLPQIQAIVVRLAELCGEPNAILRLYVSRGPGGFSPHPGEVIGHQIYAAITTLTPPSASLYESGCRAMFSTVAAKDSFWSQIKSCNYLQNVLMKKECIERGFDFAISIDSEDRLCEGATENLMIITPSREMIVPKFDYTLRGTTVTQVMRLAQALLRTGELRAIRLDDVRKADLLGAQEAAFVGTTLGVLPVTQIAEQKIGNGQVGPLTRLLHSQLMHEMATNPALRTPFLRE